MQTRATFDNLSDLLTELGAERAVADGSRRQPIRGTVTLTSSKHVGGNEHVVVQADLADYSWSWRSPDLFAIETADTAFFVPRDQVGEVLDVSLPEQPHARTLSIELVPELTLDVTFEYERGAQS